MQLSTLTYLRGGEKVTRLFYDTATCESVQADLSRLGVTADRGVTVIEGELTEEILENALEQLRAARRTRRNQHLVAVRDILNSEHPELGLGIRGDALYWVYTKNDAFSPWLLDQLLNHHATAPSTAFRDAPCFKWEGEVPGVGMTSVLVYGEYEERPAKR